MDVDLLFIPLNMVQWKECSSRGFIEPNQHEGSKYIYSIEAYTPSVVEEILNFKFIDQNDLLLILIDPIRIQVPIKSELKYLKPNTEEDIFGNSKRYQVVHLQGKISIDAVIDRIPIQKDVDGLFHVHIETID